MPSLRSFSLLQGRTMKGRRASYETCSATSCPTNRDSSVSKRQGSPFRKKWPCRDTWLDSSSEREGWSESLSLHCWECAHRVDHLLVRTEDFEPVLGQFIPLPAARVLLPEEAASDQRLQVGL